MLNWQPIRDGTCRIGVADIATQDGVVIHALDVRRDAAGCLSVSVPAAPTVSFSSPAERERFAKLVVSLLLEDGITGSAAADGGAP
jgi:hypothetical protein